jgi:hypothetical protein
MHLLLRPPAVSMQRLQLELLQPMQILRVLQQQLPLMILLLIYKWTKLMSKYRLYH